MSQHGTVKHATVVRPAPQRLAQPTRMPTRCQLPRAPGLIRASNPSCAAAGPPSAYARPRGHGRARRRPRRRPSPSPSPSPQRRHGGTCASRPSLLRQPGACPPSSGRSTRAADGRAAATACRCPSGGHRPAGGPAPPPLPRRSSRGRSRRASQRTTSTPARSAEAGDCGPAGERLNAHAGAARRGCSKRGRWAHRAAEQAGHGRRGARVRRRPSWVRRCATQRSSTPERASCSPECSGSRRRGTAQEPRPASAAAAGAASGSTPTSLPGTRSTHPLSLFSTVLSSGPVASALALATGLGRCLPGV